MNELARFFRLIATDRGAALTRLQRGIGVLRARWLFRRCEIGERVNVLSGVRVLAEGKVRLGNRVQFWEGMIPQELLCFEGAELTVGDASLFNYGVSIRAVQSVRIGARCMFGSFVHVHDHNGKKGAPIVIGDDVWIAHGAIVEPGVTIGDGSVVSAGSVVVDDVPAGSLAVGNPARCTELVADPRGRAQHEVMSGPAQAQTKG